MIGMGADCIEHMFDTSTADVTNRVDYICTLLFLGILIMRRLHVPTNGPPV
jgi:hypothetical protein